MEQTWGQSHLAMLSEDESQSWLLGVITQLISPDGLHHISNLPYHFNISIFDVYPFTVSLLAELEGRAAALRCEVLQHITIALVGVDFVYGKDVRP